MLQPNEQISFGEMANRCGLAEYDVRRLIRHAMVNHRVFEETRQGFIKHSAASLRLATDSEAQAFAEWAFEEEWPAYAKVAYHTTCIEFKTDLDQTVAALKHFNKSQEPNASVLHLPVEI